jgi:Kae1-associated kinase Bud32
MGTEIARGAEAIIKKEGDKVIKDRIPKSYRHKEIDEKLRTSRTKREAKILEKLKGITPKLIKTDKTLLEMEYIEGKALHDILTKKPLLAKKIGEKTGLMHDQNIVHGDLTTGNMILDKKNEIKFIDFGLSSISYKTEDKAVDLHLFLEAVESKHYAAKEQIWKEFLKGYNPKNKKEILERLEIVEKRGRNKQKY